MTSFTKGFKLPEVNVANKFEDEYKEKLDTAYNKFIDLVFDDVGNKIKNAMEKGHQYTNLLTCKIRENFIDEENKISFYDVISIRKTNVFQTKSVKAYNYLNYTSIFTKIDEIFKNIDKDNKYKLNYYYYIANREKYLAIEVQWQENETHKDGVEKRIKNLGNPRFK